MTHTHEFIPLPAQALPEDDGPDGYRLQKAGENGYVVISGFVQSVFVVTEDGVVVVDAPLAIGDKLTAAIKSVTDKPVTHFIYTHSHADHVSATTQFENVTRIAHEEAARILAIHNDPARPLPDQTFDGPGTTLTIGGETIELIYPGPNHEVGNILVWFPAQKLAMMTDLVMPGWAPYRGWGNADYPPGMLLAHDAILATDFETYVGGHVYRTGTRADVEQSREFYLDLWTTTQRYMGEVAYGDAMAAAEPANAWAAQTVWFQLISSAVTKELIERWSDRVAAVDTFTPATVEAAIVSISTDGPINFPPA
jgi:glyoxylase-like metal-dependent hydrolase (beta-lactamase superfamily II)